MRRQSGQPPHCRDQLGGRTFEQASTAQAEQRISTEKMFISVERDVAAGVPGHGYYVEGPPQCLNGFTFAGAFGRHGDAFFMRGDHPQPRQAGLQLGHAADVVRVVVGQQDGLRTQPGVHCRQHRRGLARIDHHRRAIVIDEAPDVIVGQCGQGGESHRIGTMPALQSSRQATLDLWFDSEPAQTLYQLEQQLLLPRLSVLPTQPWLWMAPTARWLEGAQLTGRGLRLHRTDPGYAGEARCTLPLPLPDESVNVIVLQHVTAADAADLLAECERVLMPGGRLFLTTLNPFSPFRAYWRRHGMVVRTPQRLRQLMERLGLECDVSRYIGPVWHAAPTRYTRLAPLRAACLFAVEKRTLALPGPTPVQVRWRAPLATPGMTRSLLDPNENH